MSDFLTAHIATCVTTFLSICVLAGIGYYAVWKTDGKVDVDVKKRVKVNTGESQ